MQAAVDKIVDEFAVSDEKLFELLDAFQKQATEGLQKSTERGMPMIPTYMTKVPKGTEKGTYLAADLGGTNFRVCSVTLDGNHGHNLVQEKWPVPHDLQVGSSKEFFKFLAKKVQDFLCKHHEEHMERSDSEFRMGFTFSFPVDQHSTNSGTLLRWTKGFDIKDAVGKDVTELFQQELDALDLKVHIAAIVNDTVGALMARSYHNDNPSQTIVGCIFGTGTNAAYFEKVKRIGKFKGKCDAKIMAVNTEWGSFDNDLTVLPNTRFDVALNKLTANRDFHMFEKRVSGMFLGELLRQVLLELNSSGLMFKGSESHILTEPWGTDTSVPSIMETDTSDDLTLVGEQLQQHFGLDSTLDERRATLAIAHAIGTRAAYIAATAVCGLLKLTEALDIFDSVDIGGDGSVFEFYPNFVQNIRKAMRVLIGDDEQRVTFGLAKDGSGVGAALCALEQE